MQPKFDNPADISSSQRIVITIAVMLVAIIEVLDMTIVNVALPPMMGSLSASSDQITWVLTSYIVSAAVFMPLTGFLVARFGRKRLLLLNIVGFLIASVLCGMSVNLVQMVIFRTLQGIFGAALVPLSQLILNSSYPPEKRGQAMAIWGMGIMAAPVLGPTLGGYITDTLNWRWIFYINIPVCLLAFFMCLRVINETPSQKQTIDWLGMILMATGIGCLQIFLDRGNGENWFESKQILAYCIISVISLALFIIRGLKKPDNIINLKIFADRNFASSCLMITVYCASFFGIIALQSLMLENLMGYPTVTAGELMAPRGIASFFSMAMVANLITRFDPRKIIAVGLALSLLGTYAMTYFSLESSTDFIIWSSIVQGFGMGLFFVPLSTIAFTSLSRDYAAEASGLFSFGRSLGQSIGISIYSTILSRETQINWNHLIGRINEYNSIFHAWQAKMQHLLSDKLIWQVLAGQISKQATMIAFIDCYWAATLTILAMFLLLFLMDKPKKVSAIMDIH
ncbi:MAG: multidrug transporter [Gammaproteobacteria bacterium]|jgi:DHA2 family multidrug resistance protein|nr:multidrug transporter [Gammaproteobacteria bacterium]